MAGEIPRNATSLRSHPDNKTNAIPHSSYLLCRKRRPEKNFSLSDFYSVKIGHLMGFFGGDCLLVREKGGPRTP